MIVVVLVLVVAVLVGKEDGRRITRRRGVRGDVIVRMGREVGRETTYRMLPIIWYHLVCV